MKQHRIALGGIEVRWLDTPAVQLHAAPNVDAKELCRQLLQGLHRVVELLVVGQHAHTLVLRKLDEVDQQR